MHSVSLVVNCTESIKDMYCRIKIGELGKATIIGGWKAVVQECNLKEGQVYIFSFIDERKYPKRSRLDSFALLRLVITKLHVRILKDFIISICSVDIVLLTNDFFLL